jgi:glycosyltransferase domain-containing protein
MTEVSIIIPTYNRPNYLKRLLEYYSKFGGDKSSFNIIVADCSSDESKKKNKETIDSFPDLKILHLSAYAETIKIYHQVADSLNRVQSRYCLICADDDFITPNGIKQSIEFLENNPDFIATHGLYINFRFQDDRRKETRFRWRSIHFSTFSIESKDAKSRLEYHSANLVSTFFAVYRTEYLKMIYEELLRSKVAAGNPIFGEWFITILTLTYGKLKSLDILYCARDANTPRANPVQLLHTMIKDGTYDEEYARFRDYLATHISRQSQLDIEESMELVDKTMSVYLEKYDVIPVIPAKTKKRILLDSLHLPGCLDKGITRIYSLLYTLFVTPSSPLFPKVSEPSKHPDELDMIRNQVLAYAKSVYGKERFSERLSRAFRQS